MGLFDKKNCSICGAKVGMLDKKLADGHICKECRKKLSPYFSIEKSTTEADIRNHLDSRAENSQRLAGLELSGIYGDSGYILLDENNRLFAAIADTSTSLFGSGKAITCLEDALDFNPDVLSFDQIESVKVDVDTTRKEEKKTENGEQISYDPKHYTYMNAFYVVIKVKDHPYIREMRIPMQSGTIQVYTECPRLEVSLDRQLLADLLDIPGLDPTKVQESYDNNSLGAFLLRNPYEMPDYIYGFRTNLRNRKALEEYIYYMALCKAVKEHLER